MSTRLRVLQLLFTRARPEQPMALVLQLLHLEINQAQLAIDSLNLVVLIELRGGVTQMPI